MLRIVKREWMALTAVAAGAVLAVYWNIKTPSADGIVVHTPTHAESILQTLGPDDPTVGWGNENCGEARFQHAAVVNAGNLYSLSFAPFHRPEHGWLTYAPLIATEIGTRCSPTSAGFAAALAQWQRKRGMQPTGQVDPGTFAYMKAVWQDERPFVLPAARAVPPRPTRPASKPAAPARAMAARWCS